MKRVALLGVLVGLVSGPATGQAANVPVVSPPTPLAAAAPPSAKPRRIPTSEFAESGQVSGTMISPDGTKVIARLNAGGKKLIGIHSFNGDKMQSIALAEKQDLRWYRWAGNGTVLISVAETVPWYDDEIEITRLLRYSLSDRSFLLLGKKGEGPEGDDLLYTDPAGEWILLSLQKYIYDYPSVFRVNLADNKMTEVVKQRSDVWEWYADDDGVVRAGIGFEEKKWSMVYRKTAEEKFRKLGKARYDDEDAALNILRFARDSDEGYTLSNKETGRYALYKFNYATKQIGEKVFGSDTNDISDYTISADGKTLRSVTYTDERDRIVWFDPALKLIQADLDKAVKNNEVWISSRNKDDKTMILWTGAANNPGRYYLYRPDEGVMRSIGEVSAKLKPADLAPTKYVHYKARDGLEIPAYLTLPVGRGDRNLPLILLPHGGPYYVRDTPDYNPEVQFFANRGYAVLQPNYRGSDGYGKDYYEKGAGQWGRAMQDDLDDGMDWLAKAGTIDPKRVCIVGGSYGGYAALWGATRNPERYRCAASFAGVSDLKRQLSYQLDFAISRKYQKDWRQRVQGAADFDVKTVSPLYTIDRLKIPVLLAHGDADQTVPYKQSKLYVDALKKAGKPYEFYTYPKEGHGFSENANMKDWLDRLDAFLAKYNPAQ